MEWSINDGWNGHLQLMHHEWWNVHRHPKWPEKSRDHNDYIKDHTGPLTSALLKQHAKFADAQSLPKPCSNSSSGGHNPAIEPGIPPVFPSLGDVPRSAIQVSWKAVKLWHTVARWFLGLWHNYVVHHREENKNNNNNNNNKVQPVQPIWLFDGFLFQLIDLTRLCPFVLESGHSHFPARFHNPVLRDTGLHRFLHIAVEPGCPNKQNLGFTRWSRSKWGTNGSRIVVILSRKKPSIYMPRAENLDQEGISSPLHQAWVAVILPITRRYMGQPPMRLD